ncbi:mycofactocin biosynthesis chaperone MftB [Geodermatophilus sp. DSM 44513]|uniref:mycofactocin biosynthesis chaperone MftB n=1 Tax=Geodermatophilus sp. DSM 44513 TaxID=1528104 RepID=UPI0028F6D02B|nr:mycofactocin biosynthesis chaperone MftB [Geodermatophilus sp. DSM 44513]WNV75499.1 mycofactocin biosynthesis chaperone MftB [Geodermatophilus sp. DSM 44513]
MRGVLIDAPLAAPVAPPGGAGAASPSGSGAPAPAPSAGFDPSLPWRKAPSVALRPEPFGALVYSFGTRKLSFLKSKALVTVVETLAEHPSADAALVACGVPVAQQPAYRRALADLARSQMIERRTSSPPEKDPPAPHRSHARGGTLQEGRPELAAGPCDEATPEAHR